MADSLEDITGPVSYRDLDAHLKPLERAIADVRTAIKVSDSLPEIYAHKRDLIQEVNDLEATVIHAREDAQIKIDASNAERDAHLAANAERIAASDAAAMASETRARNAAEQTATVEARLASVKAEYEAMMRRLANV